MNLPEIGFEACWYSEYFVLLMIVMPAMVGEEMENWDFAYMVIAYNDY